MFQTFQQTINCDLSNLKTKCAEIHYRKSNFMVLCIFCGMTKVNYADFLEHFQKEHFEDFSKALQNTEDEDAGSSRIDPLGLEEQWSAYEENVVFKQLKNVQHEIKECKLETETLQNHTASSTEETTCAFKTKTKRNNALKLRRCSRNPVVVKEEEDTVNLYKESESEDSDFLPITSEIRLSNADDSSSNNESASETEEIDWSESYAPNMLRTYKKRPYKPRNKANICTYCGRTFRRRHQLDTHLNIHTGLKPHQCDVCGRQFRAVTTLTRHMNTHEQRETINCKFCAKTFTHKAALVSHEMRHTQTRRVPCDECSKLFYTVNQMDTHKRKVHNADDATLPYACDLCTKRYRSRSMLSTHKLKQHLKTAKFKCEKCDKKFIDEQKLQQHQAIHISGKQSE